MAIPLLRKSALITLCLVAGAALAQELPMANWEDASRLICTHQNGKLLLTDIGIDSSINCESLSLDPKAFNTVEITYRAWDTGNRGQLYYRGKGQQFSDERRFNLQFLKADGNWHTMKVTIQDLVNTKSWETNGLISGLRLDMTDLPGGKIEISRVFLSKNPELRPPAPLTVQLDSPVWPVLTPQFVIPSFKAVETPYFIGGMISNPMDKGKVSSYLIRRSFYLPESPVRALLFFSPDDAGVLYLNGKKTLEKSGWQDIAQMDVAEFLQAGENLLAIQYTNHGGAGGILADLQLIMPDGNCIRIGTDKTFKTAVAPQLGWETMQFDDSKWDKVIFHAPPPALPWDRIMPFVDISAPQKAVSVTPLAKSFLAGENSKICVRLKGKVPALPTFARLCCEAD